jgi:gluconate 2-dehydrogenase alpha chain
VNYLKGGESYFQPANGVLLASYTYENVRLLLLSKSKPFLNGLANNRRQVGRHYFSHFQTMSVSALFPFNLNNWYGLPAQGVAVDNWADDNFDHAGLDFIGGGNLWVYSDRRPIGAASISTFGKAPAWGGKWKSFIKENADRWNTAYIQKTTLPYEDNVLDLDPTVKDPLGYPVIRITAEYKDNEKKLGAFMRDKMERWYREAGAVAIEHGALGTMGPSTHAYGGTRMGDNRETNVVNRFGFSHEVPNLGVLGASVMGTSGARNPTLTAQALAWRSADHLAKNWSSVAKG